MESDTNGTAYSNYSNAAILEEIQNLESENTQQVEHGDCQYTQETAPNELGQAQKRTNQKSQNFWNIQDKTIFDWLQLFAALLGSVAIPGLIFWLSYQQAKTAEDNQRHEIMSKYYDEMTDLLEEQKLESPEVRSMARARTLSTLRQLEGNGERKGQVIKFLYETNLIGQCKSKDPKKLQDKVCNDPVLKLGDAKLERTKFDSFVLLSGVDLSNASLTRAVLSGIDLTKANMKAARLKSADLPKALLDDADLETANLETANLSGASLVRAKLKSAILKRSNLRGANLKNADLTGANLQGADLRGANLTGAKLDGAQLKDALYNRTYSTESSETKFPAGFNPIDKGLNLEQN